MSRSRPTSASIRTQSKPPEKRGCCYTLDRFPQLPGGRLRCPVDGGVLRDAVKSKKCGHVFGLQCAIYYSIEHDKCPVCSAPLDCADLEPEEFLREEVAMLRVSCAEGPDRCTWSGPLSEEARHKNGPQCSVQRQDCPFCDAKGLEVPKEFEAHKNLCDECIVICETCCEDMPRKALRAHQRQCDGTNIPEPLRRQRDAAAAAARAPPPPPPANSNSSTVPKKTEVTAVVNPPMPTVVAPEIDLDDDLPDDEGQGSPITQPLTVTSSDCDRLPSRRGETNQHVAPCDLTGVSATAHIDGLHSSSMMHQSHFLDPTNESSVAGKTMELSSPSAASSDFSPPPPKTAPTSRSVSESPQYGNLNDEPVSCPFHGAMGCKEESHTRREMCSPSFLMEHLSMISQAFTAMRAEHETLKSEHRTLHAVVEQQKRTIKMLEVRQAFHGGKLSNTTGAAPSQTSKASNAGLVDSPRQAEGKTSQESTPVKRSTTQGGMHRSNSSPAAPSRAGRSDGGSTGFVPAAPPKKPTAPPTIRRSSVTTN